MELQQYVTKKNLTIFIVAIVVVVIGFLTYDLLVFRLKSTTPDSGKVADSSVEMRFNFSQPLMSVGGASLNGENVDSTSIEDRTLVVEFEDELVAGDDYKIVLSDVSSKWFNGNIDSIETTFSPQYVDYNDLSAEEQRAQVEASNSGQVNDDFINNNAFPIFNERWQIEADVLPDTRSVILYITFLDEVPDYDNGGKITPIPDKTAEKYREEVLDEIKKRGGDPDDYEIIYKNEHLSEEYNNHSHD